MKALQLLGLVLLVSDFASGQSLFDASENFDKKRTVGVSVTFGALSVGSVLGLDHVWYNDFDKSKLHLFNDSHEWQQMDKFGHAFSAYSLAKATSGLYNWSGINSKNSALIGALFGFAYTSTFEFLDGRNKAWGFSFPDVAANFTGSAIFYSQTYFWGEDRIKLKFSFSNSELAKYRPEVLGNTTPMKILKDYNGQTYWLSFNPWNLFQKETKIPRWINLAVGYGIQDQLYGNGDTYVVNNVAEQISFSPYRELFFSLDIDFEKIPTSSKSLKILFKGLNFIKVPFPALQLSRKGVDFRPLYF